MTNDQQKPTAVFFGTPHIAAVILEHLLSKDVVAIAAIVTNPDKPAGRGKALQPPPVKTVAERHNLEVIQPTRASDPGLRDTLQYLTPDLLIVVAYGSILPKELLESAKHGALNVHPSLLPQYRGANPIAAAIDAGELSTGVTVMLMDEEMDHGPVLAQSKMTIKPQDTTQSLTERLAKRGATLLAKTISAWIAGTIKPKEQNHKEATYTTLLTKQDGQIDWSESADAIERHVRAFYPWPSAWTILPPLNASRQAKRLKIIRARARKPRSIIDDGIEEGALQLYNDAPVIRTGNGVLELIEVQIEGKQPMSGEEFLNGYKAIVGKRLL